jgi:hypothetical protein
VRPASGRARAEPDERRAEAAALGRCVGEAGDQRMPDQQRLHDAALHADTAAVDQPDLGESPGVGRFQVVRDDRGDVARREGVKIERILDRDADGLVVYSRGPPSTCSFQWSKLRRSSPESLHCQNVAARSKNWTSTTPTRSALAVSATF